jgi:hypothetical protein
MLLEGRNNILAQSLIRERVWEVESFDSVWVNFKVPTTSMPKRLKCRFEALVKGTT